jgi:hypothetical protein
MKTTPKSVTMKSHAKANPYFSAYPLKALPKAASPDTITGQIKPSRRISSLRIMPMANPYTDKTNIPSTRIKPLNIQPGGDTWYNNYE